MNSKTVSEIFLRSYFGDNIFHIFHDASWVLFFLDKYFFFFLTLLFEQITYSMDSWKSHSCLSVFLLGKKKMPVFLVYLAFIKELMFKGISCLKLNFLGK